MRTPIVALYPRAPPRHEHLMQVGLFVPCFVDSFYPHTARATVALLEQGGFSVVFPPRQTCCGQPQFNAGHRDQARRLASRFCDLFDPFDVIVRPSGSCTAMVRDHYPELVGPHPVIEKVLELSEFLRLYLPDYDFHARLEGTAVLHVGCHSRRRLGIAPYVRELLSHVRGLTVIRVPSDDWCCGFGGTFSIKFPEVSVAIGRRKLHPILQADVDYIVSTDPSCSMHLQGILDRAGLTRPVIVHLADVLASGVLS